jgi:CIC family chloride channel protein
LVTTTGDSKEIPLRSRRLLIHTRRIILIDALSLIVGVIGGLGAVIFRLFIKFNHIIFQEKLLHLLHFLGLSGGLLDPALVLAPILGGLVVGPIVAKLAPETKGHGVPEVMEAVLLRGGRIRTRVALVKIIVSSITIGSGGSAGREGPIAQIGASFGSILGRIARLDPHDMRLLVTCGLSAGIAGTFNAPLGGALFGMEILLRNIGLFDAIPIIFSSVVGATTASIFLGERPSFIIPHVPKWAPQEIPIYLLHGAIMGLIAVAWVTLFYAVEDLFDKIPLKQHVKPALGAIVAGVLLALFPEFGVGGVGYEGVNKALAGSMTLGLLLILALAKMLATAFTVGSGGSGGVFAPSLYIGAMFGSSLFYLYAAAFGGLVNDPLGYALAGMAALFAAAAQAPLNVIIMIPEMSRSYTLIPPIMASAGTSFVIAWLLLRGSSIYTKKLEKRGIRVRMLSSFILDSVKVEEIMTSKVVTIEADAPLPVLATMFEENPYTGYPVVKDGRLVGMVTRSDLERAKKLYPKEKLLDMKVIDIASKSVVKAYPDETIREVVEKMRKYKISRFPVVSREDPYRVVGIISIRDLVKAFEKAIEREEKGV